MSRPKRIQRKRTKGWRMPEGAVYVGRPTVYGNPFTVGADNPASDGPSGPMSIGTTLRLYRVIAEAGVLPLYGLRGLDLACWCPLDQPCHADVLLEVANR